MEPRYGARLEKMMSDAVVSPEFAEGLLGRLEAFVEPFAASLWHPNQRRHAAEYVTGLVSNLGRKTGESIAYLHDHKRQSIQGFLGLATWDHKPLLGALAAQVGEELGEADGVVVFDPSGFAKKGTKSVGVGRQWCGRLGKVDNCQIGVYMAYVSRKSHALVNTRLYLPVDWTKDRRRMKEAGVPKEVRFQTRHKLALEMLTESGGKLPHRWVAGDDEMGRSSSFRRELQVRNERYLLAVPSNTLVRDLDVPAPEYSGRGRRPMSPFMRMDRWRASLPESAWTRLDVRDGEKGPLVIEAVKRRIQARTETGGTAPEELSFVTRELLSDGTYKYDYYLSNADPGEPLKELGRVSKAAHRIEECFKRGKGEAGLADYQVRNWPGWHHHQTLSLLAAWFLDKEARRGKNTDPRADDSATPAVDRGPDRPSPRDERPGLAVSPKHPLAATQRACQALPSSCA